jgi:hypothetical protein
MQPGKWYKGNIHTHTTESDGDASPERVVGWYRRHNYDFLVLSDHNHRTILEHKPGRRRFKKPLMIPGEEVSASIKQGTVPVHINGIGISRVIEPLDVGGVVPTIQANVDAILAAGGIASLNHPNGFWAFDHEAIVQVTGATMMEVYNGWPGANNDGTLGHPGHEQMWDAVLSAGRAIFGVATDDSHNYSDFTPMLANPGRGWAMVRAAELSQEAVIDGFASGNFYASTGIALTALDASQESVSLEIEQVRDWMYTTTFTGRDGVVLSEQVGLQANYRIEGDEGYVRATVRSSQGARAWTQPVFLP